MYFRIADANSYSLTRLTGDGQKAVKTNALPRARISHRPSRRRWGVDGEPEITHNRVKVSELPRMAARTGGAEAVQSINGNLRERHADLARVQHQHDQSTGAAIQESPDQSRSGFPEEVGLDLSWEDFTIDHIKAWSRGGPTSAMNAQLMHRRCNSAKGAK
jgi:hypothetical protein